MKYLILIISSIILVSSTFIENIKLPKPFNKAYKYIPSGKAIVDADTFSIQSFYMLDHEITNGEYREFLESIDDKSQLGKARIHNELWTSSIENSYLEPMEKTYHSNEAYNDYPVVNITKEGAEMYCKWLENIINKDLPDDKKIKVRLPMRSEFIRAGAGTNLGWQYAWGNNYLTNSEGKYLCNFTRIQYSRMSRGENNELILKESLAELDYASDGAFLIASKKSYYPNIFEIYNLNGNVAEWISDGENQAAGGSWYDFGYDVRLQSVKKYGSASPFVGFRPVFTVAGE